jgi:hypothetical protein
LVLGNLEMVYIGKKLNEKYTVFFLDMVDNLEYDTDLWTCLLIISVIPSHLHHNVMKFVVYI